MGDTFGKSPDAARERPGNTPVEQQERDAANVEQSRPQRLAISGPGAADFLTAAGGLDLPGIGTKGMAQTRDEGLLSDPRRLAPRLGPDDEGFPGERAEGFGSPEAPAGPGDDDRLTGSQTGTIGGGGPDAHNASPVRATGVDDPTAGRND